MLTELVKSVEELHMRTGRSCEVMAVASASSIHLESHFVAYSGEYRGRGNTPMEAVENLLACEARLQAINARISADESEKARILLEGGQQ